MDLYKVLGVHRNASKDEIKQAFRNLAMQFHPDKHAHSPKHLKDSATLKFKQLSEAYEILIDDRKRADYNIARHGTSSWNANGYRNHNYRGASGGYGYGYNNNYGYGYSGGYTNNYTASRGKRAGTILQFESLFQFLNAQTLVRTAAIAGVLIGGIYFIDAGADALWNTKNSGRSLEDALESIKEAKAVKDKR